MEPIHQEDTLLGGQAEIWQLLFGYVGSMALKCAIELGIADIINSHGHGGPITLSQMATGIGSSSVDIAYLERIMRFLVSKEVFTAHHSSVGGGETLYGLNNNSRWLLSDAELSLTPMAIMVNHPWLVGSYHCLSHCVKEGSNNALMKAYGCGIWDYASQNPEFNRIFNEAMECTVKIVMRAFLSGYNKDGFDQITSMVDVGGGTGGALAEIVKAYPHIKGINFDLPHVIVTAPAHDGISHVEGNMFEVIPNGDAVFMKWILHDWDDEACIKILQNCRKAIPEKTGKIILVEIIRQPNRNNHFGDLGLMFDLTMLAYFSGGKERNEVEWKMLLEKGGFPRYKIINIPALPSIIEAYPQ